MHLVGLHILKNDWNQAFVVLQGFLDFLATDLRGNRVRAEDKHKGIGQLNAELNLLPPVNSDWIVFPINSDLSPSGV